jgi:hypothetical protein
MTKSINVNVGGGNATFGSIVQGEGNTVVSHLSTRSISNSLTQVRGNLLARGKELGLSDHEMSDLIKNIEALAEESSAENPDKAKGGKILKAIKDNVPWAYPIFKDFVSLAWPALMTYVL